jgi:hypothetical protein
MSFAPFEPLPGKQEINERRTKNIELNVKEFGLIKLQSDYLDMSQFYLEPLPHFIWQVQTVGKTRDVDLYKPMEEVYKHIAELNNLQIRDHTHQPESMPDVLALD